MKESENTQKTLKQKKSIQEEIFLKKKFTTSKIISAVPVVQADEAVE